MRLNSAERPPTTTWSRKPLSPLEPVQSEVNKTANSSSQISPSCTKNTETFRQLAAVFGRWHSSIHPDPSAARMTEWIILTISESRMARRLPDSHHINQEVAALRKHWVTLKGTPYSHMDPLKPTFEEPPFEGFQSTCGSRLPCNLSAVQPLGPGFGCRCGRAATCTSPFCAPASNGRRTAPFFQFFFPRGVWGPVWANSGFGALGDGLWFCPELGGKFV